MRGRHDRETQQIQGRGGICRVIGSWRKKDCRTRGSRAERRSCTQKNIDRDDIENNGQAQRDECSGYNIDAEMPKRERAQLT